MNEGHQDNSSSLIFLLPLLGIFKLGLLATICFIVENLLFILSSIGLISGLFIVFFVFGNRCKFSDGSFYSSLLGTVSFIAFCLCIAFDGGFTRESGILWWRSTEYTELAIFTIGMSLLCFISILVNIILTMKDNRSRGTNG